MPRRSGPAARPTPGRAAPSRPSAGPPQRPAGYVPAQQQTRPSSTSARAAPGSQQQHNAPPPSAQAQQQQQQQAGSQPGMFSQIASTAAGVAVGSTIGHAVGSLFGGSSEQPQSEASPQQSFDAQQQQPLYSDAQPMDSGLYASSSADAASHENSVCANDVRAFRKCMDDEKGNLTVCGWYLDQLKACQSAAKQY